MEFLVYKVMLTEQELITLKTILEDTLHENTDAMSYEDAVIRGVIEQLTEQWEFEGLQGSPQRAGKISIKLVTTTTQKKLKIFFPFT